MDTIEFMTRNIMSLQNLNDSYKMQCIQLANLLLWL